MLQAFVAYFNTYLIMPYGYTSLIVIITFVQFTRAQNVSTRRNHYDIKARIKVNLNRKLSKAG